MKVKITRQTTWSVEITPAQKRKRPTGGKPQQSIIQKTIQIITQRK